VGVSEYATLIGCKDPSEVSIYLAFLSEGVGGGGGALAMYQTATKSGQ
jgi:hypothetical protein